MPPPPRDKKTPFSVGVLKGEGNGPELIDATLCVLDAVADQSGIKFNIEIGGEIGNASAARTGQYLSAEVAEFCRGIFSRGGAILSGPGCGRFVYDMRRHFGLYYKLNPLRSYPELRNICKLKLPAQRLDILLVRENLDDVYQGKSTEQSSQTGREVRHLVCHKEANVRAVVKVAAQAAHNRRNDLAVITKDSGLPVIHSLWRRCALEVAGPAGITVSFIDIDYAAYKLLQNPQAFDVIVAPNFFGDILSDLGGVLAGSRGLTYGGSFSETGAAVYQTNHGAAHDLAGRDEANPTGQIFSLAMLLRRSFGLERESSLIEDAVQAVWAVGWRTADLNESGCRVAGTKQFAELVAEQISGESAVANERCSVAR